MHVNVNVRLVNLNMILSDNLNVVQRPVCSWIEAVVPVLKKIWVVGLRNKENI
jgi:hypothetical protein